MESFHLTTSLNKLHKLLKTRSGIVGCFFFGKISALSVVICRGGVVALTVVICRGGVVACCHM